MTAMPLGKWQPWPWIPKILSLSISSIFQFVAKHYLPVNQNIFKDVDFLIAQPLAVQVQYHKTLEASIDMLQAMTKVVLTKMYQLYQELNNPVYCCRQYSPTIQSFLSIPTPSVTHRKTGSSNFRKILWLIF